MAMSNSKIASSEHCGYCFDMLLEELSNIPTEYDWTTLPLSNDKMPVFVTWYKLSSKRRVDELRGCLGTFSQELPIKIGLKKYSIMSALNDKRFDPIPIAEIYQLKCSISLLHSFTRSNSWNDWELGKHGITINFSNKLNTKQYNATYLPEVSAQQKWNKLTTIEHLVIKAGYNGNIESIKNLQITKYQSCKFSMTWNQYLDWIDDKYILRKRVNLLFRTTKLCKSKPSFYQKTKSKISSGSSLSAKKLMKYNTASPPPQLFHLYEDKFDNNNNNNKNNKYNLYHHKRFMTSPSPSPSRSQSLSSNSSNSSSLSLTKKFDKTTLNRSAINSNPYSFNNNNNKFRQYNKYKMNHRTYLNKEEDEEEEQQDDDDGDNDDEEFFDEEDDEDEEEPQQEEKEEEEDDDDDDDLEDVDEDKNDEDGDESDELEELDESDGNNRNYDDQQDFILNHTINKNDKKYTINTPPTSSSSLLSTLSNSNSPSNSNSSINYIKTKKKIKTRKKNQTKLKYKYNNNSKKYDDDYKYNQNIEIPVHITCPLSPSFDNNELFETDSNPLAPPNSFNTNTSNEENQNYEDEDILNYNNKSIQILNKNNNNDDISYSSVNDEKKKNYRFNKNKNKRIRLTISNRSRSRSRSRSNSNSNSLLFYDDENEKNLEINKNKKCNNYGNDNTKQVVFNKYIQTKNNDNYSDEEDEDIENDELTESEDDEEDDDYNKNDMNKLYSSSSAYNHKNHKNHKNIIYHHKNVNNQHQNDEEDDDEDDDDIDDDNLFSHSFNNNNNTNKSLFYSQFN